MSINPNMGGAIQAMEGGDSAMPKPAPSLPGADVADVRCRVFRAPVKDDIAMSFSPLTYRVMVVVEVELDDGSIGMGESWANYPSWAWRERIATIRDGVRPTLIGYRFGDPVEAYSHMATHLGPLGRQWGAPGPIYQAISGADTALWDIAAQNTGGSLASAVAAQPVTEIPIYASSLGPSGVEDTALRCRELGIARVKVKLGFGLEHDLATLTTVRNVLGSDAELYGDANQGWSLDEAVRAVEAMGTFDIVWFEEPVRGDRVEDLSALHDRTGVSLATGENLYGAEAFEPYLTSGAVDIVQPDVSKVGGVTPFLRVVTRCAELGRTLNPHLYNGSVATHTTIQLAAAAPTTGLLEWDVRSNALRGHADDLLTSQGAVRVPADRTATEIDLAVLTDFEEIV